MALCLHSADCSTWACLHCSVQWRVCFCSFKFICWNTNPNAWHYQKSSLYDITDIFSCYIADPVCLITLFYRRQKFFLTTFILISGQKCIYLFIYFKPVSHYVTLSGLYPIFRLGWSQLMPPTKAWIKCVYHHGH